MRIITLLILLLAISSCQYIPKNNDKIDNTKDSIQVIKKYYEKSGALKSEITVKNKKKNGPAKEYYASGELRTFVNYENNVKVGETFWYYKNGQPYRVTPYVKGQMEGIRKIYYQNGKIKAEIPYKNDNLIEGTKEYDKKGNLISFNTKILFETIDLLEYENKYILKLKLSKKYRNIQFYEERISTEKKKILVPVFTNESGTGKIEYILPPGNFKMAKIKVYCQFKTSLGNPVLISSTYNLAIENR